MKVYMYTPKLPNWLALACGNDIFPTQHERECDTWAINGFPVTESLGLILTHPGGCVSPSGAPGCMNWPVCSVTVVIPRELGVAWWPHLVPWEPLPVEFMWANRCTVPCSALPKLSANCCDYSEPPLIRTPEMRPTPVLRPLQSMLLSANPPLKWGHPSNQDTLTGPKGGQIRGSPHCT